MILSASSHGEFNPIIRRLDSSAFLIFPNGILGGTMSMSVAEWRALSAAIDDFIRRENME